MDKTMRLTRETALGLAFGCAFTVLFCGTAFAQSASSSLSAFSKSASGYEAPVDVSNRDANGNLTIVNGVMQSAQGSIFSNLSNLGAAGSTTGAGSSSSGSGSATAIGNNLSVVVNGDYNTVIVNSSQTNNGAVSATTVLNGKVNLDGAQ